MLRKQSGYDNMVLSNIIKIDLIFYKLCECASEWVGLFWPDPVAGPTVTPAALHLGEARDAALFPTQTAAGPVDEFHTRFGVHCEVEEQTDHLPVCQNSWLSRTCIERRQHTPLQGNAASQIPKVNCWVHPSANLLPLHDLWTENWVRERMLWHYLLQTPQWSWEESGWGWGLSPERASCSQVWAAAAGGEPLPRPNAPPLQTTVPPAPRVCPAPTQLQACLGNSSNMTNEKLHKTLWLHYYSTNKDSTTARTEIFPLDTWKSPDCVIFHWQTTHTHWKLF